jgi:3',5'-cyclic AMP phosphodiesterase CpdA
MFRLVHLSDPHLGPLPPVRPAELVSKRVLGYVNWQRNRARAMAGDLAGRIGEAVAGLRPDHIAVTGDLANLGLSGEFVTARRFLEGLGQGDAVSVVPGNHDAYVPGVVGRALDVWAEYARGDDAGDGNVWPYVRRRGEVALIGLTTARASAPFMATGGLGRRQSEALGDILDETARQGLARIVMLHHQPVAGATSWMKRLTDGARFARLISAHGAELILHGHTHRPSRLALAGPGGTTVPVVGVPSASQRPGGHKPASGFNVVEIGRSEKGWAIVVALRQYDLAADDWIETRRDVFGG